MSCPLRFAGTISQTTGSSHVGDRCWGSLLETIGGKSPSTGKQRLIVIAAVVAALCVLNAFCAWYYNPTAYDHDDARATDTIREAGAFTSRATEGNAWAVIDSNGYNNTASQTNADSIAILMMGSSHTEALNVAQDESTSYLLNEMLSDDLGGNVYSIGISAHRFARNAANLDRALTAFAPTDYVVAEAADLALSVSELERALTDSFERQEATDIPLPEWMYNQPLAKTAYKQMQALLEATSINDETSNASEVALATTDEYRERLTALIKQMKATANAHGVELIIYYHPHLVLQNDGTATSDAPAQELATFRLACDEAGVVFINMEDAFLVEYDESFTLPHGFSNTLVGGGHLNADGHRMVAETLYKTIMSMEESATSEENAS